ncbi:MAG TPA: PAS domain-containing protein, partial [Nitrospira sp.]|nr:PAS domain-containing protein [Nitrospira sp.]
CGISTDISERKQTENALRSHERQLRLALTSKQIGVWNWDIETDCMFWSPQVDEFLGMPPVPGHKTHRGLLALVHPDDREVMARAAKQVMDPFRTDLTFEHRVKRSDGMMVSCIWTGHIVRDHAGKAVHVLGTVRATPAPNGDSGTKGFTCAR